MIRPFDYLVILVFALLASSIIYPVLFVPMHWVWAVILGMILSFLWDLWTTYEKFRLILEDKINDE